MKIAFLSISNESLVGFNKKRKENTEDTANDTVLEKLELSLRTAHLEVVIHYKPKSRKRTKNWGTKTKILEHRSVAIITLDTSLLCSTFALLALVFSYLDNNF